VVILLLACTASSPSATDTGAPPDTADSGAGGDSADTAVDPADVDADGDGVTPNEGDCDDTHPNVYPGAPDYCDGLDADCDGEPIPDGSCFAVGDASVQWSWWIRSGDFEPLYCVVGEVSGDGTNDIVAQAKTGSLVLVETTPLRERAPVSDWGETGWSSGYPAWVLPNLAPPAEMTGDGVDDVIVTTDSQLDSTGGVFLFPGRTTDFPTDAPRFDEGAQAWWLDGDGLEMDSARDGSVGDVTGDGLADVLVRTVDRTHDHLTLVPGDPEVTGEHGFAELPSIWTDEDDTDAISLSVVGDLDGDGCADLRFDTGTPDVDSYLLFMSGADWVDGGHLRDEAVTLTVGEPADGEGVNGPWQDRAGGDLDQDGLDDALVSRTEDSGGRCATILSGGLPSGDLGAWTFASVCGDADASPESWTGDLDEDGVSEIASITGFLIPSAPLAAGGTFDIADLRTPRVDPKQGLRDITDLDGDGRPEWIFTDSYDHGETYILAGFDIPWEDDTKW